MAEQKEDDSGMSFPENYNFNKESLKAYSQGVNSGFKDIETQPIYKRVNDVDHVSSDDIFNA